jgi:stringent starvation protein B
MNSTKPYLIRAFYEWIADSDCTPHIVVNAETPGIIVPEDYVESGQIVLNIAMSAVRDLQLGNEAINFKARFGGVPHEIFIPIAAVTAIYARENGRGMVFTEEDNAVDEQGDSSAEKEKGKSKGKSGKSGDKPSHLTVVK